MSSVAQIRLHSDFFNAHVKSVTFTLVRAVNLCLLIKRTCFRMEIGPQNLYFNPSSCVIAKVF
jgi:hypothetical protein